MKSLEDIEVGHIIGSGFYNDVVELLGIGNMSKSKPVDSKTLRSQFVVKRLRGDLSETMRGYGAMALAKEAKLLSGLAHPNIITLHCLGQSTEVPADPVSKNPAGNAFGNTEFLIIERMDTDLAQEIKFWKEEDTKLRLSKSMSKSAIAKTAQSSLYHRIGIAYQVISALVYLHSHNIAFRDLKPQNIGLVANNIVKIFDFGLSKKLLPNSKLGDDKYHCTQNVGTPRFMAPEVFSGTIYGLSADIYSFSLVLWELLSLEVCFKNLRSVSELYSVVHKKNSRPAINKKWPRECRKLMEESWSEDPSKRLSAIEISEELQVCMRSFLLKCGRMEKK